MEYNKYGTKLLKSESFKNRTYKSAKMMCRLWQNVCKESDDPWYRLEYKQGLQDCLTAMAVCGVIYDFNLNDGIIMEKDE